MALAEQSQWHQAKQYRLRNELDDAGFLYSAANEQLHVLQATSFKELKPPDGSQAAACG